MTDAVKHATKAALRAINDEIDRSYTRRQFVISKFDRHPDGYLHARVVVHGQPYYFHRRYGSWLAPGHLDGQAVLTEPEGLLGSQLGQEVKYALSEKSAPYDNADRKQREAAAEAAKRRNNAGPDDEPRGADALRSDDGLRQREHHQSAHEHSRAD